MNETPAQREATPTESPTGRTTWPVKAYLGALLFALVTLAIFTPALDGHDINNGRARATWAICGVLALRLGWAVVRRERSGRWRGYLAGMLLAAPIWLAVEPGVLALDRWLRGAG